MDDHQCPNEKVVQVLQGDVANLSAWVRKVEGKVGEHTTFFFGPERNGGGWVLRHEREHEEAEVELKEMLEVVRGGIKTLAGQVDTLMGKVKELCDRRTGWREVAKMTLPAIVTAAAAVVAVVLK